MVVLFCIVAIIFFGCAVYIVRSKPPKSGSRPINAAIAITALALLILLIIPWAEIAFNQFSSKEKDNLARKHYSLPI